MALHLLFMLGTLKATVTPLHLQEFHLCSANMDLENQIEGINEAIAIREEQKVNSTSFFIQSMVFVAALVFMIYVLFTMFSETMGAL